MATHDRFLTTHIGSLPRQEELMQIMFAREDGIPLDQAALEQKITSAVNDVVARQIKSGVDIINDGEMSKPSYATYVKDRFNGFGGTGNTFSFQDIEAFPNTKTRVFALAEALRHEYEAIVEAANPRHAHEWTLFENGKLPEGKMLVPGVIECQSNYIEHPQVVAQRIERYAHLVGRDNVMAAVDCGFSIHVGSSGVDPDVVWAKLESLAQGAEIASRKFWG